MGSSETISLGHPTERETIQIELSVVIPVFNGAETIGRVVRRLLRDFADTRLEIILVNDGSTDDSGLTCEGLVGQFRSQVRYLELEGNHGEHNAVLAGLGYTWGDFVAVMDDDGQNTPAALRTLLTTARQSKVDVVFGNYAQRKHNLVRRVGSLFAQHTAHVILGTPKTVYLSSFKIMRRQLVQSILSDPPANPYIDGLIFQAKPTWDMVEVEHEDRLAGKSGYNFRRLVSLWWNIFITADCSETLTFVRRVRSAAILALSLLAAFWVPWLLGSAAVWPKMSLTLLLFGGWLYGWAGWALWELSVKMGEELAGVEPFTIVGRAGRFHPPDSN